MLGIGVGCFFDRAKCALGRVPENLTEPRTLPLVMVAGREQLECGIRTNFDHRRSGSAQLPERRAGVGRRQSEQRRQLLASEAGLLAVQNPGGSAIDLFAPRTF